MSTKSILRLVIFLLAVYSLASLVVVNIQSGVIQQQRHLIHRMADNPACTGAPTKTSDN